jgi:hypothetical protein
VVGAGLLVGPEAQAVTAEPVRCSAWLGVAVIPNSVFLTVFSALVLLWLWMCPWPAAKTLEVQLARSKRASWIALAVSLLVLLMQVALRQGWMRWESAEELDAGKTRAPIPTLQEPSKKSLPSGVSAASAHGDAGQPGQSPRKPEQRPAE